MGVPVCRQGLNEDSDPDISFSIGLWGLEKVAPYQRQRRATVKRYVNLNE